LNKLAEWAKDEDTLRGILVDDPTRRYEVG
jgi:hypothetical protein